MDRRLAPIPPEAEAHLPPATTRAGRLARGLLGRFPIWPVIAFLAGKRVPRHRHSAWYMLGGFALFFFLVQVVTGVLLMVYYRPDHPWQSVQRIVTEVPFGNVIRSVHHWGANLMVLVLFLHLFSTFFMKAYRAPRELTWLTGLGLLGLTMAFGFSGYLLPWDDLSFFATRVGVSELEKAPGLGPWLANLMRGGPDVTVDTIGRFYPLHVVVLPLAVLGLVATHLLFIQLQGVSEPDSFAARPPEERRYHRFFTEFLVGEIPAWLLLGAVLAALAVLYPRALSPEADPAAPAPRGIKPEWYFLSQYQALKLFPGKLELLGQAALGLVPLAALLVPFLDRRVPADRRGRAVAVAGVLGVLALVSMTVWGWLS
ncbi:MAG TPA: cytochrome b N-terminal domain-containing protein [Polyangia bacterium]|jgi:cytochrome b6